MERGGCFRIGICAGSNLPEWAQVQVTIDAAIALQRWLKADAGDIALLLDQKRTLMTEAKRMERSLRDTRTSSTVEHLRARGGRDPDQLAVGTTHRD